MLTRPRILLHIIFGLLMCLTVKANAQDAQLDAPHDAVFGTGCLSCHDLSAFMEPNMIPDIGHVPGDIDDTQYNNICWGCHDDVTATYRSTHSSLTSSNKYGDWTVECVICHNQHKQDQDRTYGTTNGKFIRTKIDLSKISGLSKTGIKVVKFTGPADFADGDGVIDGICEVCHTQTAHFRNDGTLSGVGVHAGLTGTDCTACHDHNSVGFAANCGSCHDAPPTDVPGLVNASGDQTGSATAGAHAEHSTNQGIGCGSCHYNNQAASHDDGLPLVVTMGFGLDAPMLQGGHYDGQVGVNYDATVTAPATTVTDPGSGAKQCSNLYCHSDGTYVATGDTGVGVWNTPQWDGTPMACNSCHGNGPVYANGAPKANSHVAHVTDAGHTCDLCHNSVTTDGITITDVTEHVDGTYDVTPKAGVSFSYTPSAIQDGSGGTCAAISCHSNVGADWGGASHVMPTVALCLNCHTATNDPYYGAGEVHNSQSCDTCHDPGASGALIGSAAGAVSGDGCQDCHSAYFDGHTHHTSTASVVINTSSSSNTIHCTGCHTSGTSPFVGAGEVHTASSCATCHNTGTDGSLTGSAATADINGIAADSAYECGECHTGYFDGHTVHTATGGHDVTFNAVNDQTAGGSACNLCHGADGPDGGSTILDSWDEIYTLHTDCVTCHDYDQTNGTWNNTPVADVNASIAGAGIECGSCHTDKAGASHGGHNASDWDYSLIGNDCVDCHADGGLGTIAGVHSDACTLCHVDPAGSDYTRKVGDGGDGDATLAVGRAGDCLVCHPGATYTKTSIHHDTANAVASPTSNCTTACHNTTTGHAGDHSAIVADTALCANCHTATAGGVDNVPVDATSGNLVHDYCTSCHVNPGNDLIDTVAPPTAHATTMNNADGTTDTTNGGGACAACHTTYFDAHEHGVPGAPEHSMPTVALCTSCHTATTVPYVGGGEVHNASGCATCHNAATGALQGSASSATGGENCQGCHTGYFDNHNHGGSVQSPNHTESLSTDALCANCHGNGLSGPDAITAPYTAGSEAHSASGCLTCHDAADGTPVGSATNWGATWASRASGTCATCHTTYFDGHGHDHTSTIIVNTASGSNTVNCVGCHTAPAGTGPFTGAGEVHNPGGCATCHDAASGALKGSASTADINSIATDAAYECGECHSAYFDGHDHGVDNAQDAGSFEHDVAMAGDTSGGSPCNNCHNSFNDNWSGTNDIAALHTGGCGQCHNSARNTDMGGGYTDVQDVISTGTAVTCLDCHASKSIVHMDHLTNDQDSNTFGAILESAQCTSCHTGGGTPGSLTDTNMMAIHDVSGGGCGTCHVSASGGGVLRDYSGTGGNIGEFVNYETLAPYGAGSEGHGGTCVGCHASYGSDFTTGHKDEDHVNHALDTDMLAGTANCTSCHTAADAAAIAGTVHSACNICHTDDITDGTLKAGTNGTAAGHTIDSQSTCADCHTDYNSNFETAHDAGDHSGLGSSAKCAGCHTGNIITDVRTHGDGVTGTCTLCHANTTNDGSLLNGTTGGTRGAYAAGDASGHDITVTSACVDCHSVYSTSFNGHQRLTDHDGVTTTASCVSCHTGNVISNPLTHNNACAWCHVDALGSDGTLRDGTDAGTPLGTTSAGDATGHDITVPSTCADCHATRAADFTAHAVKDHTGIAAGGNCTTNCHAGDIVNLDATPDIHQDTCTNCHTNTTNDGSLKVGPNGNGTAANGSGTCVDCHGNPYNYDTQFGTIHDVRDHNGVTSTASCITAGCHTGDIVNLDATPDIHKDTCTNCHTNTTTNGYFRAGTRGDATGGSGNCASCHTNHNSDWYYHQLDHTPTGFGYVLVNSSTASNTVNCTGCHTGDVITGVHDRAAAGGTASCQKCHDAAGALQGSAVPGGGECNVCHTTYFTGHTVHTASSGHDVAFDGGVLDQTDAGTPCNNCHGSDGPDGGTAVLDSWDEIHTLHTDCTTCHDYDGTNGTWNNTPLADVTSSIAGSGIHCTSCHTDKDAPAVHGAIDHTTYDGGAGPGVVKGGSANCVTCHDPGGLASDAFYIGTIHDTSGRGCGTCHNNAGGAGSLVSYAAPYSTASGSNALASLLNDGLDYETATENGGFCDTCHSPYAGAGISGAHNVKDHDQLGNQTECNDCHTEALGSDIQSVIHSGIGCSGCHDTGAGYIMKAGTSAANHTYGTTDSCTNCHTGASSEFDGTTTVHSTGGTETHATMLLGNANCTTNCHQGNVQTVVHSGGLGCQNCHTSASDGTLIGSASAHVKGVAQDCTDCHTGIAADFTAHTSDTHTLVQGVSSPQCTDCHDPAGTKDILVDIHGNGVAATCTNCHTNITTNGTMTGSAGANHTVGTSSDCADCHVALNSDFTAHTSNTHSAMMTGLGSAKCTTCHDPSGTLDIINDIHDDGDPISVCDLCHTDTTLPGTDGRFVADTANATISNHTVGVESGCINCHPAYDTDFAGAHDVKDHNELSTAGAAKCTSCHGTINIVSTIHNNTCDNCHTDTVVAGGTDGTLTGSAANHDYVSTSNCLKCHTALDADFQNHSSDTHDTMLANYNNNSTPSKDCDNCHTAANGTAVRDNIHSTSTCSNCHVDIVNDGSLRAGSFGNATLHTIGVQSNCTTCHGVNYFQYHTYGNNHTGIVYDAPGGDTSQSGMVGCGTAGCHNDAGSNLSTWAAIKQEHDAGTILTNGCVRCHDYDGTNGDFNTTGDPVPPPDTIVGNAIANGSAVVENCRDCHIDKAPNLDHGGHSAGDFTADAVCQNCHSTDVIGTVHSGGCGTCHESSQGSDQVLIGSAANCDPTWATGSKPHACTECHIDATPDHKLHHHKTPAAQLGQCETCHDASASITMASVPRQLNCVACHMNDTGTQLEVIGYDNTLLDASNPVDPSTGPVASHTIVYEPGVSSIAIYDFRMCLECHSGENPLAATAPVIRPFHGYPGDWTKGYLYIGAGQLPGLGSTTPAAYSNGLDDLNDANELPWLYMQFHPGPGLFVADGSAGIRRFNDAMVTRMGGNNQRLYDITGAILNPNTDGGNKDIKDFGRNGGFSMVPSGVSLGGGLDALMAKGGAPWSNKNYSQFWSVPYGNTYAWTDNSGPYTEVPRYPDVTNGDVIRIIKAEWDGTDLYIEATNSLGGGATLTLDSYTGDASCDSSSLTWDAVSLHFITCAGVAWTSGDTVTVSSSAANSLPVTRTVNDAQGAGGPAPNSLSVVTANWVTNGDGSAQGSLLVTATVDNDLDQPQYAVDYDTLTAANLTWSGIQTRWEDGGNFTNVAYLAAPGSLRIYDPGLVGDSQLYSVTNISDVVSVTAADYDDSTKLLNVTATEAGNDPYGSCSGAYYATYNSTDYLMTWTGTQLELVDQDVSGDPGYNSSVTVHCASAGGDSVTYNSVVDSTPVSDDVVTIQSAAWTNNGNGAALGSIYITATHTDGDGGCAYSVTYNGSGSVAMTWTGAQYEATITDIAYTATINTVEISGPGSPCDTYAAYGSAAVNLSDAVTVTQADHDGSTLTVAATESAQADCGNTYYVDYNASTSAAMNCAAGALTLTWNSAPAFVGGSVTVYSTTPGGDSQVFGVTDTSGGGPVDHAALGHVTFAALATETCANCHSGDTVAEVHKNDCNMCHTAAPPTLLTSMPYDTDQVGGLDTLAAGTCGSCHMQFTNSTNRKKTWYHHYSDNAQGGNCVHCHHEARTDAAKWNSFPEQAPCAYCHINYTEYDATGNFQLQSFDFVGTGFNTPISSITSDTHTIPNLAGGAGSPIEIQDFAACVNCHDTTDMMDGMTGAPSIAPNAVRPYHASGVPELADLNTIQDTAFATGVQLTPSTSPDPGFADPQIPLDYSQTYDEGAVETIDAGCVGGQPLEGKALYDNISGQACNDDLHFAYYYHPGRGGIVDTSTIIGGASSPAGAFNTLYKFLSPASSGAANPKWYNGSKNSEDTSSPKSAYKANGLDGINGADNYASCNSSYNDGTRNWNFCGMVNVPYNKWTPGGNGWWVTVPKFTDKIFGTDIPNITDEVRITSVDCGTGTIEAWTKLTEDFHLGSQNVGDVTVTIQGSGPYNMTWNGTRWTYTGTCATGNTIQVDSSLGDGTGTASITAP